MRSLLLFNLLTTGYLTGLIWTIQGVHYPLFALVDAGSFPAYHRTHSARLGFLAGLPMATELLLSMALVVWCPPLCPLVVAWVLLGLTVSTWVATVFVSVPLHERLGVEGHCLSLVARLVTTNWLRTAAWSIRLALLGWVVWPLFG